MPSLRYPRHGSLQYWPRKRADSQVPRIRSWAANNTAKLLGFPGYKAGMLHAIVIDNIKESKTKGEQICYPLTVVECPSVKIASVVFYKKDFFGSHMIASINSTKNDKELSRTISVAKNPKKKIEDIIDFDDVRVLVYTQPKLTTIGKKKPELFELALGGKKEDKLKWAIEHIDKEITVKDVFKPGQQMDAHAITKGHGRQGVVKRFGIGLKSHKSEKGRRKGVLTSEGAGKVTYTSNQAGQMGYHQRFQHNIWLLNIGEKPEDINPSGGFHRYGVVRNNYILVKGSVQGPAKRMVIFTEAIRQKKNIPRDAPKLIKVIK
jgi:large subunit ribosomal protein L3